MTTYTLKLTHEDVASGTRGSASCAVARRLRVDFAHLAPAGGKIGVMAGNTCARVIVMDDRGRPVSGVNMLYPESLSKFVNEFDAVVQWEGPDKGARPAPHPEVELVVEPLSGV